MKTSSEIAYNLMSLIVQLDEIEYCLSENPEDPVLKEQFDLLNAQLIEESGNLEDKIDAYGSVIAEMTFKEDHLKSRAEFFARKAKIKKNQIDRVKSRIVFLLEGLQLKKVEGKDYTMALRKPSASVEVYPETEFEIDYLPEEFLREKREINKTAVKEFLLKGQTLEFAKLVYKTGLQIT